MGRGIVELQSAKEIGGASGYGKTVGTAVKPDAADEGVSRNAGEEVSERRGRKPRRGKAGRSRRGRQDGEGRRGGR